MKMNIIDKNDTLDSLEDPNSRRVKGNAAHDAFSIGRRFDILKKSAHGALPSHVAEEDKSIHYLEVPFKAFNLALVDNASFEYSFLSNFFSPSLSYQAISRTFDSIFAPTFSLGR